jgi:hypothetical protein
MDAPLEIRDGLYQFRPDRVQDAYGSGRMTFIKAQALRLSQPEGICHASILARCMTEQRRVLAAGEAFPAALKSGDRVAVLHFLCSGNVLGDLTLFEKGVQGWRQVPMAENVPRSDKRAHTGPLLFRNTIRKVRPTLRFDVSSLDLQLMIMDQEQTSLERHGRSDVSHMLMRRIGNNRANSSVTVYRRLSSRIGRILAENEANILLVAGGAAGLVGRSGIRHPLTKFLTVAHVDGSRRATGYLANSLNRAGIPIFMTSAQAAAFYSKDFIENSRIRRLRVGRAWRERCNRELSTARIRGYPDADSRPTEFGPPTHFTVDGRTCPYAVNAAWSLLLYWTDERYQEMVDRASVDEIIP